MTKREYTGLRHCFRTVIKQEGIRGLYSGLKVGVCGITVYRSLYFGLFDSIKRVTCGEQTFDEQGKPVKMSLWMSFLAAQVYLFLSLM